MVWYIGTNVSEEPAAPSWQKSDTFCLEDGMILITLLTISDMRIVHKAIPVSSIQNPCSLFIVSSVITNGER
jgi:hypothetical protein